MRLMPILDKAFRDFASGTSVELDPNGGVSEVDPMANVPSSDPARIREALQDSREPTDAENAISGKDNYVFL
jgi:hypothetical protein